MIDLTKLPAADAERIAYAEGFTGTAALFARIADAEELADPETEDRLRAELDDMELDKDSAEANAAELRDHLETAVEWAQKQFDADNMPAWVADACDALEETLK